MSIGSTCRKAWGTYHVLHLLNKLLGFWCLPVPSPVFIETWSVRDSVCASNANLYRLVVDTALYWAGVGSETSAGFWRTWDSTPSASPTPSAYQGDIWVNLRRDQYVSVLTSNFLSPIKDLFSVYKYFACMWNTCVPGVHRGQKRVLDPLELELLVVWVLETKLARAANALNFPPSFQPQAVS